MKWYVYELCGPDGDRFYIGKGCGARMRTHLSNSHSDEINARIARIRRSGEEPICREVAYFYSEQDALRFESDCIAGGKGLLNKAQNPKPPRKVSLLEVFYGVVSGHSVSPNDIQTARNLAQVAIARFPKFKEEYSLIDQTLAKVATDSYA